jgi:hypothetical protein
MDVSARFSWISLETSATNDKQGKVNFNEEAKLEFNGAKCVEFSNNTHYIQ